MPDLMSAAPTCSLCVKYKINIQQCKEITLISDYCMQPATNINKGHSGKKQQSEDANRSPLACLSVGPHSE